MTIVKARKALTLVELIIVLGVLVAISGIVVPLCSSQLSSAAQTATRATLAQVQLAMQDYWLDTKLIPLDGTTTYATEAQRFDIAWLFLSPVTNDQTAQFDAYLRRGWNGPYLLTSTVQGEFDLIDAWNNQLHVQNVTPSANIKDVRIVSSGPNGLLEIPSNTATSSLTSQDIGDDVYVALSLR